jgi:ABC-type transport system involved in cytochrome c biogenesis permease subunit
MPISAETERLLLIMLVVTLAVASAASILVSRSDKRNSIVVPGTIAVALILATAAIAVRWVREDQGPFLTLYDVLLSNLFSLAFVYLAVYWCVRELRPAAIVVMPLLLLLGVWLVRVPAEAVPLPATYANYWLWLHVISGKFFFGLCLAAAGGATLLIVGTVGDSQPVDVAMTRSTDTAIWRLMSMAFICQSFMLVAGAVWAHSAWGRYWAWDSLEVSALLTWLVLALLLHVRITYKHLALTYLWAAVVLVFALAFLTFLGVPFVSIAAHKGLM